MPIVINEFEVVAEAPPAAQSADTATADAGKETPALAAIDIEQIERFLAERAIRVWAH
jgi:hypothetical protein